MRSSSALPWTRVLSACLLWACVFAIAGCGDVRETPGRATGLRLASFLGPAAGALGPAAGALDSAAGDPTADAGFATADEVVEFEFPRDHGSHPRFRSEWWYLTAMLADDQGREYGVQFTLFRQALSANAARDRRWRSSQVYLGHLALADVARREHVSHERLARGHQRLAGVSASPFRAWIEGWRLEATGTGTFPMRLVGETTDFALDLEIRTTKDVVRQGDNGLSRKGPDNASYYYSVPRLAVAGSITRGDETIPVAGRGWLDREWSTSVLAREYVGWNWFALQLDDGRDVMVYALRRADGRRDTYDQGVLVAPDGSVNPLASEDFTLRPVRSWQDDRGVTWPLEWSLVFADGETLFIDAAFDDQVMQTTIRYWEGFVQVARADGERVGTGYMELTGY
ncbi:MAG: carotenoid 1,2-hydratase [Gammaproteobacteria bacterium]|nr:carotenoid 1,2-hydratase [Gammaproteobacteria bacterium]